MFRNYFGSIIDNAGGGALQEEIADELGEDFIYIDEMPEQGNAFGVPRMQIRVVDEEEE